MGSTALVQVVINLCYWLSYSCLWFLQLCVFNIAFYSIFLYSLTMYSWIPGLYSLADWVSASMADIIEV